MVWVARAGRVLSWVGGSLSKAPEALDSDSQVRGGEGGG